MFILLVHQIISWFLHLVHRSLNQLSLFFPFWQWSFQLISWTIKSYANILCQHVFTNIICFYMENETVTIHITKFSFFRKFCFYIIIPKPMHYSFNQINLSKQDYSGLFQIFSFYRNFPWNTLQYVSLVLTPNSFFFLLLLQVWYFYVFSNFW